MDPTVQVAVVSVVGGLALAGLGLINDRKIRRQSSRISDVHEQVANSHTTNLRDDLDRVIEGIETLVDGQRRHDDDIGSLRDDLRVERQERLAMEARQNRQS